MGLGCFEFVEPETKCLTRSSQRPPLAQQGSLVLARLQLPTLREVGTGCISGEPGETQPCTCGWGPPLLAGLLACMSWIELPSWGLT